MPGWLRCRGLVLPAEASTRGARDSALKLRLRPQKPSEARVGKGSKSWFARNHCNPPKSHFFSAERIILSHTLVMALPRRRADRRRSATMSAYSFLDPRCKYRLPTNFDYAGYIETEQELWAL